MADKIHYYKSSSQGTHHVLHDGIEHKFNDLSSASDHIEKIKNSDNLKNFRLPESAQVDDKRLGEFRKTLKEHEQKYWGEKK